MTWRRNWKNRVLQGGKRGGVKLASSVFVLGRERLKRERGVKIAFLTLLSIFLFPPPLAALGKRGKNGGEEEEDGDAQFRNRKENRRRRERSRKKTLSQVAETDPFLGGEVEAQKTGSNRRKGGRRKKTQIPFNGPNFLSPLISSPPSCSPRWEDFSAAPLTLLAKETDKRIYSS